MRNRIQPSTLSAFLKRFCEYDEWYVISAPALFTWIEIDNAQVIIKLIIISKNVPKPAI